MTGRQAGAGSAQSGTTGIDIRLSPGSLLATNEMCPFTLEYKPVNAFIKCFQGFMSIANISPNLFIHIAILRNLVFFHDTNDNGNDYEKTNQTRSCNCFFSDFK
jgi:hypothetical protein